MKKNTLINNDASLRTFEKERKHDVFIGSN